MEAWETGEDEPGSRILSMAEEKEAWETGAEGEGSKIRSLADTEAWKTGDDGRGPRTLTTAGDGTWETGANDRGSGVGKVGMPFGVDCLRGPLGMPECRLNHLRQRWTGAVISTMMTCQEQMLGQINTKTD
jgi:hypothetical protein